MDIATETSLIKRRQTERSLVAIGDQMAPNSSSSNSANVEAEALVTSAGFEASIEADLNSEERVGAVEPLFEYAKSQ